MSSTPRIQPPQSVLLAQAATKKSQIEVCEQQISAINLRVYKLTQSFNTNAAKLQQKINKVQFSRPRGNPANQWPHRPMCIRVQLFYEIKEAKEQKLSRDKDLLKQTYDHKRAILSAQKLSLENAQFDLESELRQVNIQLH